MHVFVYRTVKLFLDMGAVSDRKRCGRPRVVRTPQVINAVKNQPKSCPKTKNNGSGNGYYAKNHESHYQIRLGTFKRQTGQRLTVALNETRGKNQDACFRFTVKSATKKFSLQVKNILLWRKLLISKTIEFMD